jgi:acyl-CoA synthetase (AMP-forming)/AMP-acid ligase II
MKTSVSDYELAHTHAGVRFTDTTLAAPPTVPELLERRARERGSDPYLSLVYEREVRTITYAELDALSARVATHLRRDLQIAAGDTVALLPTSDIDSIVAIYAVLRAGCPLLFVNPGDPPARLRAQLEALGVSRVLRSRIVADELLAEAIAIPDASCLPDGGELARSDLDPGSAALLFGTSGSTAASKIVAQSHHNAIANAHAVSRHHRLRRGDRLLGCLPFHHVNAVHLTLFATLFAGAHAVVVHTFDPCTYCDVLEEFKPKIASVVPSLLEALLDTSAERTLPREFDYFVSAAAPLAARTARSLQAKLKARVLQGYGLTETTNFSTTIPADISEEAFRWLVLDADVPSIGTALYGNEVAVLRTDGTPAAPGETGELCMRGHNVMIGYLNNELATAEAFRHGWFHSGDLGYELIEPISGLSYFVIAGRIKNMAKVGGETVSLEEMERALLMLPEVQDAACASRPHRLLGDQIIAAVVLTQDLPDEKLREHLRSRFSQAAQPGHIVKMKKIPRTPTGKIRRQELALELTALAGNRPTRTTE